MNLDTIKRDLLNIGYVDIDYILAHITSFLGDFPTLQFQVEFCPVEEAFAELICCSGKIQGTEIKLWLKQDFPGSAPIIVVCPPDNFEIVGDHPIVRQIRHLAEINIGRVELPLLSNWVQGTKLSEVIESVLAALSLTPWTQGTGTIVSDMKSSNLLEIVHSLPYVFPQEIVKQGEDLISNHPHLKPKQELFTNPVSGRKKFLQFDGTISIWYQGRQYPTPIVVWIRYNYPEMPPDIYVNPTLDMEIDLTHPNVSLGGAVTLPCLTNWHSGTKGSSSYTLVDVIQVLRGAFTQQPPMFKQPASSRTDEFMKLHDCDFETAKRFLNKYSFEDASMHFLMEQTAFGEVGENGSKEDLYGEFPHIDQSLIDAMFSESGNADDVRKILLGDVSDPTPAPMATPLLSELDLLKRKYPTLIQLIDDLYAESKSVDYVRQCISNNTVQEPIVVKEKFMDVFALSEEFPDVNISIIQKMFDAGKSSDQIQTILLEKRKQKEILCEEFSELHPQVIEDTLISADDFDQAKRRLQRLHTEQCRKQMIKDYPDITDEVLEALFGPEISNINTPPPKMVKQSSAPGAFDREELLDMYSPHDRKFGFGDTVLVSDDGWDWKKAVILKTSPDLLVALQDSGEEKTFPFVQADISAQEMAHLLYGKYKDQRVVRLILSYVQYDDLFMRKADQRNPNKKKPKGDYQIRKTKDDLWEAKIKGVKIERKFETQADAQRFIYTEKVGTSLNHFLPSYIGGTILERKVMRAYNFMTDTKYSLLLCAASHADVCYSEFRKDMDDFLENIGSIGCDQIAVSLPVDVKLENEALELGALIAMGWTIHLFVAGMFVKTFKPFEKRENAEPLFLNRNTDPIEYQLFEWHKDKLNSSDQQTCQMLVDDAMQAGGDVPSLDMLHKYFEEWQIGPAMELCQKLYEEAINLIAAQDLQAEEERKAAAEFRCSGCYRYQPREIELYFRNCGCVRCFECSENWMQTEWFAYLNSQARDKKCSITCQACSVDVHQDDIKRVSPELAEKVAHQQLLDLLKEQGAVECFHENCDVLFFPAENTTCANGHVNCLKCRTSHTEDEDCPASDWAEHAPKDIFIIRRFLWPNKNDIPPEFTYLQNNQNCTSNSVVGPKAFKQIGGSFGLINSVKDSDIVGGGTSNLSSGGQVAKNRMSVGQVLNKCAGRIRYVHGSYKRESNHKARIVHTNEELVERIYNDWGGQSHNEILVNLHHSMVCGLWSDEYSF